MRETKYKRAGQKHSQINRLRNYSLQISVCRAKKKKKKLYLSGCTCLWNTVMTQTGPELRDSVRDLAVLEGGEG